LGLRGRGFGHFLSSWREFAKNLATTQNPKNFAQKNHQVPPQNPSRTITSSLTSRNFSQIAFDSLPHYLLRHHLILESTYATYLPLSLHSSLPSTSTIETPFSCFRALSIPYFFSQTLHCSHATHSPLHPNLITTLIYCEHFILRPTIAAQTRISEPDFNSSPTCQISHIMPTLMPLPFPGSVHPKLDGLSVVPRILRRGSPMERSSSQQIYATALSFCRFLFTTLSFQKSSFQ
jgi:hypothetical protein